MGRAERGQAPKKATGQVNMQNNISQMQGNSSQQYQLPRQTKVWVVQRLDSTVGPLAVFASKVLADIFMAGAEAANGTVLITEMSINYGG